MHFMYSMYSIYVLYVLDEFAAYTDTMLSGSGIIYLTNNSSVAKRSPKNSATHVSPS